MIYITIRIDILLQKSQWWINKLSFTKKTFVHQLKKLLSLKTNDSSIFIDILMYFELPNKVYSCIN